LSKEDEVVVEATGNAMAVVRVLSPYVARVIVANPLQVKAIAHAHVKTDKIDAGVLASLRAAGFLPEGWLPDADTGCRRRVEARAAGRAVSTSEQPDQRVAERADPDRIDQQREPEPGEGPRTAPPDPRSGLENTGLLPANRQPLAADFGLTPGRSQADFCWQEVGTWDCLVPIIKNECVWSTHCFT